MFFEKLFQKYRKTEVTSLFIFKSLVSILLLISVLGYTWIIALGIYNDNPVVQNSLKEENYIPVPDVTLEAFIPVFTSGVISEQTDQKISCHFVSGSGIQDCNQYIKYSINKINGKNAAKGLFVARNLMFFAVPNNGISSLEFKIYLNDTSYNISGGFLSPHMFFSMTDADYIASSKDLNSYPFQNQLSTYSKFPDTIATLNLYTLASFNVLNSLGLIGGAWGFAATIYAILFGANAIKPWGLTQKYGFKINNSVQTKLKNTLEIIPFVNHPKNTNNLNNHELKRRLDSLQLFLTEYVVDVQYLEKIYKANINEKESVCGIFVEGILGIDHIQEFVFNTQRSGSDCEYSRNSFEYSSSEPP
ncbi:44194_t:CDS:2 [Gigaspora margarita]|uniref:44194_t:CDS:1 n=1 Tax=Gigaspora margarita TaxID=4874 RepID=A0ABN7UUD2_GIGMA|nr:44194_t:CDS:2 [Gigaspora margarita]